MSELRSGGGLDVQRHKWEIFLVVSVFFHCVSEILAENNLKYRLQNKREFTILPKQNQKVTIFHLCTLQLLLSVLY